VVLLDVLDVSWVVVVGAVEEALVAVGAVEVSWVVMVRADVEDTSEVI